MPTVVDLTSGAKIEVPNVSAKRALVAVFLAEVVYRKNIHHISWELVDRELEKYSFSHDYRPGEGNRYRLFTTLWRFGVEEGMVAASSVPHHELPAEVKPRPPKMEKLPDFATAHAFMSDLLNQIEEEKLQELEKPELAQAGTN